MTEEELMNIEGSQDAFWDWVEEMAAEYQVTCDYILDEFLV